MKFHLKIQFLIQCAVTTALYSQSFQKSFDGGMDEQCTYVNYCADGEFIGVGGIAPPTKDTQYVFLLKTDEKGNLDWMKYYKGNSSAGDSFSFATMVNPTTDNGFIITGGAFSHSAGNLDAFLLKTDSAGNIQWMKNYGGNEIDYGNYVMQTSDGGFLFIGNTRSFLDDSLIYPPYYMNIYFVKTDAAGDTLWTRTFNSGSDPGRGVAAVETDDGYILVGELFAAKMPALAAKINFGGDTLWTKLILFDDKQPTLPVDTSRNEQNQITSIKPDMDGGFIITGILDQDVNEIHDVFLMKTDAEFYPLWAKGYSPSLTTIQKSYTRAFYVDITPDSGYVIAGSINDYHFFLMKTDHEGNMLWAKKFTGPDEGWWYSLVKTSDKGFLIGCWSDSISGNMSDVYFIKTDSLGNGGGCNEYTVNMVQKELTIDYLQGVSYGATQTIVNDITNFVSVVEYFMNDSLLCESVNIEENLMAETFQIYPNPATAKILISGHFSSPSITLYDMFGRIVLNITANSLPAFLSVSQLPDGIYFLKLEEGNNFQSRKLIIEK